SFLLFNTIGKIVKKCFDVILHGNENIKLYGRSLYMAEVRTETVDITLNGMDFTAPRDGSLLKYLESKDIDIPSLCYHPSLGALDTCEPWIVKVNVVFVRSSSSDLNNGDVVESVGSEVHEAHLLAMDRVMGNHVLYCTECDFNNGNGEIHNTVK